MMRSQSFQNNKAKLYVICSPIGNLSEISSRVMDALKDVNYVFCEDTRVTGQLLCKLDMKKQLFSAYENIERKTSLKVLEHLHNNENVALMSDAGYPGISDPGQLIIQDVIKQNYNVVVINGPSALIQSVLASGFKTDHFYFYGFLDAKPSSRKKQLIELAQFKDTMIFYQSPHKILATLQDMLEVFGDRQICLCRELTKLYEEYIRGTISEVIEICESLKGEMVLVVKGYEENIDSAMTLDQCYDEVLKKIKEGLSATDAIKEIAKVANVSKKELYQYYHSQKGE